MSDTTTFAIDAREITAMATRYANAGPVVADELNKAGRKVGFYVVARAKFAAPVDIGNLKALIGPPIVTVQSMAVQIVVPSHAPYSLVVEEGHKALVPTHKKVMVFTAKDGTVVFTTKVKAVAARPFLRPAITNNLVQINKFFSDAAHRAVERLAGGTPT